MPRPNVKIKMGDVVRLRKPHPCGSHEWEITRVGMDVGLRCLGCSHKILMLRAAFEKGYVTHVSDEGEGEDDSSDAQEEPQHCKG